MLKKLVLFGLLFVLSSFSAAFAANEPYVISFQGKLEKYQSLLNPDGKTIGVVFSIYDDANRTQLLYEDQYNNLEVGENGIFNALIGSQSTNPIPLGLFIDRTPYLSVWVGGQAGFSLNPPQPLAAAPYAFVAKKVYGDTTGNIVYAKSSDQYAVFGTATGDLYAGVKGSGPRIGVYGQATTSQAQTPFILGGIPIGGVAGMGTRAVGVSGASNYNYGVYGHSLNSVGVGGSGEAVGGFFEGRNGEGVRGKGTTAGGSFESSAGIGINVKGYSKGGQFDANAGPAVSLKSINNDALQIEVGKIRILNKPTGLGSQQYMNYCAAGSVTVNSSTSEVNVYNGYVADNSVIILTNQGGPNCSLKVNGIVAGSNFKIYVSRNHFHAGALIITETGDVKVGYLIIN